MTDLENEILQLREAFARMALVIDRQDVADCLHRESRARDRQDREQIASCWWDDGVDEHGSSVTAAPDYPDAANAGHRANFLMTSHNLTTQVCEIDGTTAYCESYVITGLYWTDEKRTTVAFGRYLDQLEKRSGEWRMIARRCTMDMTADADGTWLQSGDLRGFLKPLWDKQDPSYDRPVSPSQDAYGIRW
jgi:hypothetical protein